MSLRSRPRPRLWAARPLAALLLAGAVLAAGCSTKKADAEGEGSQPAGPGVSAKTIKLGVLTDQTGVFAGAGKAVSQGRKLFWDDKNSHGGVCGHQVEFVVKDHGYNAQQAVAAYAQVKDEVLALDELLGSPMIAALLPSLESDQMLTLAGSWSSSLLGNPYVVIAGTTYDVEMINGLQALVDTGKLKRGDTVSHILLEGDYGKNALAGSTAAAKELGLKLAEQKIKPTDTDLTAQVTASRSAGAKAVLLTTTPAQTASAVSVAEASGYDAPFLGSNPSFSGALLKGSARPALERRLLVVTSIAPFSSTAPGPADVRQRFEGGFAGQPQSPYVMYGYAQGEIMAKILESACQAGALNRSGVLDALHRQASIDTRGLLPPLNYAKQGEIPARKVYVLRPDAATPGGLEVVKDLFSSPLGDSYQPAK